MFSQNCSYGKEFMFLAYIHTESCAAHWGWVSDGQPIGDGSIGHAI